jgi:hypothetical protein
MCERTDNTTIYILVLILINKTQVFYLSVSHFNRNTTIYNCVSKKCGYVWARKKRVSVCVELHKHVTRQQLNSCTAQSDSASQLVSDYHSPSCVCCFHHSSLTRCSQLFVIFPVLRKRMFCCLVCDTSL